jgi:hypothetical protein
MHAHVFAITMVKTECDCVKKKLDQYTRGHKLSDARQLSQFEVSGAAGETAPGDSK